MNDTVVPEKTIKGLHKIAELSGDVRSLAEVNEKSYRSGIKAGGILLAQTLLEQLGIPFNDNLIPLKGDNNG